MSGNNPQIQYDCFNNELKELQNRLFVNNLALNAKKTNYMTFTKKHINLDNKFIRMGNDNKLTWHEHIRIICNRLSKGIGIFDRLL